MIEVEAKYRVGCDSLESIVSKLESMGFKIGESRVEVDDYYQHPCRDFRATDEALRVRVYEGVVELTYKGPRLRSHEYKGRLEVTLRASEEDAVRAILESLGFREAVRVVKKRRVFEHGGVKVSVDEVEKLGCFVEIEGDLDGIKRLARELGLREEDYVAETYAELLLALGDTDRPHSGH